MHLVRRHASPGVNLMRRADEVMLRCLCSVEGCRPRASRMYSAGGDRRYTKARKLSSDESVGPLIVLNGNTGVVGS